MMLVSFRLLILWLHLFGAVVWIGGLVFQLLIVAPALKRAPFAIERYRFGVSLEARFRYVMWPAVGLVLLTGIYNVMNVLYATALAGGSVPPSFVRLLSVKLLLVVLMLALHAMQQFVVHPCLVALLVRLSPEMYELPVELLKRQRLSRLLHLLVVASAIVVMLLGLLLRA
ncbi:hypothetical protein NKDENANG_02732 [Candidatus Entotheonellaceae bacterium PAL068K]